MITKEQFTLSIGKNISGAPLSVSGYRFVNGSGPSIYIQGGTHGGEITFPIFKMLYGFLETNTEWSGTVTLIPIAHPISWSQRSYFYTVGKFDNYDGKDWNRSFPGDKDGSTTQRCSRMIFDEAVKHDLVIDLHTSRESNPFIIVGTDMLSDYGLYSGILPTYLAPASGSSHPLPDAIDIAGKKGITIECGSHNSMDPQKAKMCFEAILNMMRKEKLLVDSKLLQKPDDAFVFTEYKTYFAPVSGFVEYVQPLEKQIKKGDVLYRIHPSDALDQTIDVFAEEDGVIMKYQPAHAATVGDEIVMTVPQVHIRK